MRYVEPAILFLIVTGFLVTPASEAGAEDFNVSSVSELIEAIEDIQAQPPGDIHNITLASGAYTFSQAYDGNGNALPQITHLINMAAQSGDNRPRLERSQGSEAFRLAEVMADGRLELNSIDISGFQAPDGEDGGAVLGHEGSTVSVGSAIVEDNHADGDGGAVWSMGGLTLFATEFRNNSADGDGGAAASLGEDPFINQSIFESNSGREGGALAFLDGGDEEAGTVRYTAIVDNQADFSGGGLFARNTVVSVFSTTISGNESGIRGGGLAAFDADVSVTNVTITDNEIDSGLSPLVAPAGIPDGGGISAVESVTTTNTIIAGNSPDECSGDITSNGHDLIGTNPGCTINGAQTGNIASDAPGLGPLQNNGGFTLTHELLEGSPAIDTGDDTVCPPLDQRGEPRPQDGDGDFEAICDIGAYELLPPEQIQVQWGDGNCDGGLVPNDAAYLLGAIAGVAPEANSPCLDIGSPIEVTTLSTSLWGDWDCSGEVNPADALFNLLFSANFDPQQPPTPEGCYTVGQFVRIVPLPED